MLQKLTIQNYAIIDELQVNFTAGLNIITGETGAGKSILMGALGLVLGDRADSAVLYNKEKKCIVEGYFKLMDEGALRHFFEMNDLDGGQEVMIRREITSNGKSRSFINDTPVNLSQVKVLSFLLVDLHQQFDTLDINTTSFQQELLDAFSGNGSLLIQLRHEYEEYTGVKRQLGELVSRQETANKELDYNQFLFDELNELNLQENELEKLEADLKLLSNAESVKQQLGGIYFELKYSEQPLVQQLKVLSQKLQALESFHTDIAGLSQRLHGTVIELKDVAEELERIDSNLHSDARQIEVINERLSAGYKLFKKHGVNETNALIAIREKLQQSLDVVFNLSAEIETLRSRERECLETAIATAKKISSNRQSQSKPFASKVNKLLAQVGMPNAQLKIEVKERPLSVNGTDEINFLFDANKSNRFEPLGKVASGGELSRLMLSMKSLVASKLAMPTLIFDEIDTGISGEAARQVGVIMKQLSAAHQLIAITHQPQIAAKASTHYFVFKEIKADRIVTGIRILNNDERIAAIAKMLSGEKPTAAALENAREMVGN